MVSFVLIYVVAAHGIKQFQFISYFFATNYPKMKVKVISRNPDEYMRETKNDIHRLKRNYDPSLHPLEGPRKYCSPFPQETKSIQKKNLKNFILNDPKHR